MYEQSPHFDPGDIVLDTMNSEVGVLLRRYNLFEHGYYGLDEDVTTMVWDIYWTGPDLLPIGDHLQTYTEEGLYLLHTSGVLDLYKNT